MTMQATIVVMRTTVRSRSMRSATRRVVRVAVSATIAETVKIQPMLASLTPSSSRCSGASSWIAPAVDAAMVMLTSGGAQVRLARAARATSPRPARGSSSAGRAARWSTPVPRSSSAQIATARPATPTPRSIGPRPTADVTGPPSTGPNSGAVAATVLTVARLRPRCAAGTDERQPRQAGGPRHGREQALPEADRDEAPELVREGHRRRQRREEERRRDRSGGAARPGRRGGRPGSRPPAPPRCRPPSTMPASPLERSASSSSVGRSGTITSQRTRSRNARVATRAVSRVVAFRMGGRMAARTARVRRRRAPPARHWHGSVRLWHSAVAARRRRIDP